MRYSAPIVKTVNILRYQGQVKNKTDSILTFTFVER